MELPDDVEQWELGSEEYGDLIGIFRELWGKFGNLPGIEIKGGFDKLEIKPPSNGEIIVESPSFYKIKGVGFEAGNQGGPIDICFRPDFTIIGAELDGNRELFIKRSETPVTYLNIRDPAEVDVEIKPGESAAEVISAFHYDFELNPDSRHPLFHAQYEPSSIKLGSLAQDYKILNRDHVNASFPNHPRVPTAPLDFIGVLCMLVQEHQNSDTQWPHGITTPLEKIPKIPPWCFDHSPQSGITMLPEWWYLHAGDLEEVPSERLST